MAARCRSRPSPPKGARGHQALLPTWPPCRSRTAAPARTGQTPRPGRGALVEIANDQELDSGVALPLDWKIYFSNVCGPDLAREISEKFETGRLVCQSQYHRLDRTRGGQRYFAARHLSP